MVIQRCRKFGVGQSMINVWISKKSEGCTKTYFKVRNHKFDLGKIVVHKISLRNIFTDE